MRYKKQIKKDVPSHKKEHAMHAMDKHNKTWMDKELHTMTHYFNELDLEDEIHFKHEREIE